MSKVWITKYALTSGIISAESQESKDGMVVVVDPNGMNGISMYHGDDWHMSETSALVQAERMRVARIKSLEKQIAKLHKLSFGAKS